MVSRDHKVWKNSRYQVIESESPAVGQDFTVTHLSIKRLDRDPLHDWRDLQRIKNELCGPEREAVEVYPAESRLVDTSNQYHLWVLPLGTLSPFGFFDGRVVTDVTGKLGEKAKQRPFEEQPRDTIVIPDDPEARLAQAGELRRKFMEEREAVHASLPDPGHP